MSHFSLGRLLLQTPSWLGLKFFNLCTFYQMPVFFCWVASFLFIQRPVSQSSSLVVILTFCITASISLFFLPSFFPVMKFVIISKKSILTLFSLSGAFRALCKYKEHDPGNFFSPRKGKSSTCQSVILSISSHKGTQSSPCLNPSSWRGKGWGNGAHVAK